MSNDFNALVEQYKKKKRYANSGTVTVQNATGAKSMSDEEEEFWSLVDKYKQESTPARTTDGIGVTRRSLLEEFEEEEDEDDIAPVKEDGGKLDFFKKGAFSDGYQKGDITRTILGTAGDIKMNVLKGGLNVVEGIGDLATYGVSGAAKLVGADEFSGKAKEFAKTNLVEKIYGKPTEYFDKNSVLARTSDSILQGVGQVGLMIGTGSLGAGAGLGSKAVTALNTSIMGASSFGSGIGQAYEGGATDEEAVTYGAIAGASDALSELIFGGMGKSINAVGFNVGLSSADDILAKKVSNLFANQIAKNFAEFGVKASAEGLEEVIAGVAQAAGKKMTYMSEEEFGEILKDENLLEQFVVGVATSGFMQSGVIPGTKQGSLIEANKEGRDFITGYSQNEQAVIRKEVENRIAEKEADGTKLSKKERSAIEAQVEKDMERGYISIDTIEETLGGETYKTYKHTVESEDAIQKEFDTLNKMKQGEMTGEQIDRRTELKEKLEYLKKNSQREQLKSKLGEEVMGLVNGDRLLESYNERSRRTEAFQADLTRYDEKQRAVVQKAVESGILNNTNRTHEFVDMVAKISADKGVLFDFTNNAKLKESGFAMEGKTINGYVSGNSIAVNIQSAKSLNTVVGHEIAHVLEGTELYTELQNAVVEYAKTKGDYQSRYDTLSKLYESVEGANIDAELTADLVGDYLFTDSNFINNLSANHRNVFQKIYDEVKYLLKVATAGSKEARGLEKVKRAFEKAYRESSQNQTEIETDENNFDTDDVRYSISVSDKETLDSLNEQVARGEYNPDTNPNGGYYVTYKSMSFWGYDEDGNAILRSPMAEYVDGELSNAYLLPKDKSKLNWYQATETIDEATGFPSGLLVRTKKPGNKSYSYVPAAENQDLIQEDWGNLFFNLKKKVYKNGKWVDSDVPARYNPYEHSSNSMLNDQFSTAYLRDNLVTVKMIVPVSEDNGAFRAQWSKDSTGWTDWKTGTVAGKINKQKDLQRRVFLSRYAAPVEIVSDSEVAQAYKGYVEGTDVAIPDNVVSPNLLAELKKAGVPVAESGKVTPSADDSVKVMEGGSVTKYSLSTWTPETQEKVRNNLTNAGFEKERVDKWIKDTNSVAAVIAADKDRLDFEAADNQTMLKNNQEYVKTLDASTLCAKRLVYQGTFDAIQHRMPNTVLTSDDLIELLNMMKEKKVQTPCGVCYVESRRRHLGKFAQEWLDGYNGEYKPNLDEVTTSDGLEALRKSHPGTYDDFIKAMNKKGSSNPKVVQLRTEYRNEILSLTPSQIRKIESIGGLRVQSFSDFETPHLLDMMQAVMDMTAKGLSSQAYTKVPNFAWVFGDTGIKINLSLIAEGNGFDADGNLAFSSVEGMDINEAMKLRDAYSKNVGTIIVGANDQHILACMADERIDYIIPFHRSGWGQKELTMMGMDGYTDYTYGQNEHSLETGKGIPNLYPPDYWDYNLSGKDNAERYLNLCARTGREPKFSQFLVNNGDGSYSLQPDGSTDGYWKMLIDFKMYDNDGNGAAQQKVQPNFNMDEAYRVLEEYEGGANKLPVANDVVEEFVAKYNENIAPVQNSLSNGGQQKQYGNYNVYGEDVALEAPAQEEVAPAPEAAVQTEPAVPQIAEEDLFPDDTATVQEEYENLLAERDDIRSAMDIFAAVGDTARADQMMAEYEAVQARIAEIDADEADRLASIQEEDAPPEVDNRPEDVADNVPLTKKLVDDLTRSVRQQLGLSTKRSNEVRELIQRYSNEEFPSKAHLYTEIAERFGTYTESSVDEDLKGVKALLRTYGISVDQSIKDEIADYGQLMRRNFGKVRFSNDGLPVDVAYKEFQEALPGYFPEDIYVPTDQLMRIIEVANMDTTMEAEYEIDWQTLEDVTDTIMNGVGEFKQNWNETLANRLGKESFDSLMKTGDRYVPPLRLDLAPVRVKQTRPAIESVQADPDDIAPVYDTSSGQQSILPETETPKPEIEAPKKLTRKDLHLDIMDRFKTYFRNKGFDFDKVLKNAKNPSTFATVDNTPQRVMEKALGYKEGQALADVTVNMVAQNETEGIKWLNSFTDKKTGLLAKISKQYGIKPGSKASAAAQMYAEGFYVGENDAIIAYGDKELAADFPNVKTQENIKKLARDPRIRQIYDETLEAINKSRTRNAYPEIPRLDNYFLHFRAMEDTFSRLGLPFNPNDIRAKDLPTDLNGVTADLKPGQPYFASAMHRTGKRTSFDLLGGLEKYLTSAKNQIYHIDDIQKLRALRNYVAETYGQANGLQDLDLLSDEEAEQRIEQVYNSHLSTFAKFLNEEANVLAGKTSLIDRGLEGVIGRRGMTFIDTLNRQVGANMVGYNVSSSLTNFLAPVQAFAKTSKFDFVKAMAQTSWNKIASVFGRGDGFAEQSPVMIRRKGADRFYRTPYQKVADVGYVLMGVVDNISTELIARTKYNEFTRKGMSSSKAHYETDKWVSRLMGDRSLGQMPQVYNSKTLGLITKFQLEVRNQLDSQFYDTIQETKASTEDIQNGLLRNAKRAAKITSTFVQLAVMQHLFGKAFESVAGYNPAFDIIDTLIKTFGWDDEEDDEDTVLDNIEEGFQALLGDLPYTSVMTGGRIPIASALPVTELIKGVDQYGNEKNRWDTIKEAAPYYLLPGGYGQIKKTVAGLEMFDEDLPIAGSYTDSGNLRFPIEDTLKNRVQAGVFGQWASENARDYFNNERKPLAEKQIQEFIDSGLPIQDYWEYREGLAEHEKLGDKADYIDSLDLPISTKNLLVNNVAGRKESIDMTDYGEYGSLEEMDFATQYPEKYDVAMKVGGYAAYVGYQEGMKDMKLAEKADYISRLNLTTAQKNILINSETDRKEPIDLTGYENYSSFEEFEFAKKNPEAYAMAKTVGGYEAYTEYSDALNDIKADKDKFGKSISGTRKTKVAEYISSLDIPMVEKYILFKSEYPSTDDYNYEIIDYVNSRSDMTFEEKIEVLRNLDFDVDAEGNIYW